MPLRSPPNPSQVARLPKQPAVDASTAALGRLIHHDTTSTITVSDAIFRYRASKSSLEFHVKRYLAHQDQDQQSLLAYGDVASYAEDSHDTGDLVRHDGGGSSTPPKSGVVDNYWQRKVACDTMIKDCNDMLLWMRISQEANVRPSNCWTIIAFGLCTASLLTVTVRWAMGGFYLADAREIWHGIGLAASRLLDLAASNPLASLLAIGSAQISTGTLYWRRINMWSRCFATVQGSLEAARSFKIDEGHLASLSSWQFMLLDKALRKHMDNGLGDRN
ncbi:hypothetical protein F5X68DRAFT_230726 [Plectosphaerella plurivora]|uniref:Uncharacterized protein n=1 Tax=Plectosphaerella plurivora TaxID=936078 RepID=A0A9P8VF07_9PEZI|nr:hypothetical protein F5X68DRAFT_230726 [Plectosphaerella plurivora]